MISFPKAFHLLLEHAGVAGTQRVRIEQAACRVLAADIRCLRKILIRSAFRLLDPVTQRVLDNANTPGDWDASHTARTTMPTYQIHYFGLLADRRSAADETLETDETTPAGLLAAISARHPLGVSQNAPRAAVNDELVPWDHPLRDGDRIALLPPMSGGCPPSSPVEFLKTGFRGGLRARVFSSGRLTAPAPTPIRPPP